MSKKLLDKELSKTDEELLFNEINDIFSNCNDNIEHFELQVFQSTKSDTILYILNDNYFFGKHFSKDYHLHVLKSILPKCKENGIDVVKEDELSYVFIK